MTKKYHARKESGFEKDDLCFISQSIFPHSGARRSRTAGAHQHEGPRVRAEATARRPPEGHAPAACREYGSFGVLMTDFHLGYRSFRVLMIGFDALIAEFHTRRRSRSDSRVFHINPNSEPTDLCYANAVGFAFHVFLNRWSCELVLLDCSISIKRNIFFQEPFFLFLLNITIRSARGESEWARLERIVEQKMADHRWVGRGGVGRESMGNEESDHR